MGFFSRKDKYLIKFSFRVAERFGTFVHNESCNMLLYDDHIKIETLDNSKSAKLRYDQVNGVHSGSELIDNEASPIGRAVAGGVLLGGVGAIAGAASALKSKVRMSTLTIEYTSSSGRESVLKFFDPDQQVDSCKSAAGILCKLCGIDGNDDSCDQGFL